MHPTGRTPNLATAAANEGLHLDKPLLHTHDLDEAREGVADIYTAHHLDFRHGPQPLDTWFYHLPLRSTSINCLGYGSDVVVNPGELEDFFLIQTPIQGSGDVVCGKHHIITSSRRSSVLNPTQAVRMVWDADCSQTQVRVNRSAAERCLSELIEKPITAPIEFELSMDMHSDLGRAWWSTVKFVAEEIPRLQALPNAELMLSQLEQLLINTLLHVQPHNYSGLLSRTQAAIAPKHVKRVEEYIDHHSNEAITIEDLVNAGGVSERALYQGFKQFRGLSPMRYLKTIRFEKVRESLRKAEPEDCVTRIATDHGFSQLGRFAVEYREIFGESPSDTLKSKPLR
jgi:AraC-like DNA-binding protein